MVDRKQEDITLYCFPVKKEGKVFLETPECRLLGIDLPLFDEMKNVFSRRYIRINATVRLYGRTYITYVYTPISYDDEVSYVIADSKGIPKGEHDIKGLRSDKIQPYLERINEKLSFSESLTEDQKIYIKTEFLIPTFTEIFSENKKGTTILSWEEFKTNTHVVILGNPGMGKTTCLRKIVLDLIKSNTSPTPKQIIPIYLQLRNWINNNDIIENLRNSLIDHDGLYLAENFTRIAQNGKFFLCIDGLDEVRDDFQNQIIQSINQISNTFPKMNIFISSRNYSSYLHLQNFKYFEINPYPLLQLKEWTYQRFYSILNKSWQVFYCSLLQNNNYREIAQNPLLMSIAINLFLEWSNFPQNSASLLQSYSEALIEKWDKTRCITRNNNYFNTPSKRLSLLSNISINLQLQGKEDFTFEEYLKWDKSNLEIEELKQVLISIIKDTGLIETSFFANENSFKFKHKLLRDYFSAKYIVESTTETSNIFNDKINEVSWENIWLMACEITPDASNLIETMRENEKINKFKKATLLTRALSRNINISSATLISSCDFIKKSLEENICDFVIKNLSSKKNTNILWSSKLTYIGNNNRLKNRNLQRLQELLTLIYYTKNGVANKLLVKNLANSMNDEIRIFSKCLKYDGIMENKNYEKVDSDSFNISIRSLIPKIVTESKII